MVLSAVQQPFPVCCNATAARQDWKVPRPPTPATCWRKRVAKSSRTTVFLLCNAAIEARVIGLPAPAMSIAGMICNGGKQGCTMKGVVAVDAAWQAVGMAMQDVFIYNVHRINGATPEETMRNMGRIASPGMVAPKRPLWTFSETKRWSKEKKPYG